MIYTIHQPYKMGVYHNASSKTISQIKKELEAKYGGEVVLCNLNLFDLKKFTGDCFTKANGKVVGTDGYIYNVLAWNEDDGKMVQTTSNKLNNYAHAFGCMEIIKNGKNCAPANLGWAGGYRQRTAIGIKSNNDIVMYCNQANVSVASVVASLLNEGCVYAMNVDGGASTQCITPTATLSSARIVHTLFYAVLQNSKASITPTSAQGTCPYKEPTLNIRKGSQGEGAKWVQWQLNKFGYGLTVDGIFGQASYTALLDFQKKQKLTADGICGAATRKALKANPTNTQPNEQTPTTTATTYVAKAGDSWWGIANSQLGNGAKMTELAKFNGKTTSSMLRVGDVIKLPVETKEVVQNSKTESPKVKMMVDYAYAQLGCPYVYGSQGEDGSDKIVDWSARCFPSYTTQARANRIKKYIKDHPTLNGKPIKVFDCSGLVLCALEAAGLKFADTTAAGIYYNLATPIKKSDLMPGDVVLTEKLDHIGIVGYNGEIVEAAGSDIGVVKTSSIEERDVKSIYGIQYGAYEYYKKSPWTKFARIKGLR